MRRGWAILAVVTALAGCSSPGAPVPASDAAGLSGADLHRWTDPTTGCNYLVVSSGNSWANNYALSVSIRYRADGKPDCPGGN